MVQDEVVMEYTGTEDPTWEEINEAVDRFRKEHSLSKGPIGAIMMHNPEPVVVQLPDA